MTRPGQQVILTIGQASFTLVAGIASSHQLDVPAQIIDGSTMLPLRAVIEAIGYQLSWDGPTQTVIIVTDDHFNFVPDDEPATNPTNIAPVTITRNGETVVRADETGVHILARVLLTQAEIQSLLPLARTAEETRMSAHPNRAMTAAELTAWNEEYDNLGGMNVRELEILYLINAIRAENNLVLFTLCPSLNRAARLQTSLTTGHGFFSHDDPFYGQPRDRIMFIEPSAPGGGEIMTRSSSSTGAVTNWMNSQAHRNNLLNVFRLTPHIGIGTTDRDVAVKMNGR
jgi:uncharacterized protein YkwD